MQNHVNLASFFQIEFSQEWFLSIVIKKNWVLRVADKKSSRKLEFWLSENDEKSNVFHFACVKRKRGFCFLNNYLFLSRLMIEKARDIFVFDYEVQDDEKLSNFRFHLFCLFSWANFSKNCSTNVEAFSWHIFLDFWDISNNFTKTHFLISKIDTFDNF